MGRFRVLATFARSIRHGLLAHHGKHIVAGDHLAVLIRDRRIPAHLTVASSSAQGFFLAGETHLDPVPGLYRFNESECVDAVVREHRSVRRINEQTRRGGDQEVTVGDAAAEERIARCLRFIHVRVKPIARECREALDVLDRHLALAGAERVADGERTKGLAERMYARIKLACTFGPAARYRGNQIGAPLHGGALHVVHDAAYTAQLLAPSGTPGTSVH